MENLIAKIMVYQTHLSHSINQCQRSSQQDPIQLAGLSTRPKQVYIREEDTDIKKYLNEPDMMFRRFRYKDEEGNWRRKWKQKVTDADGKVHFVDADPKDYHPGRGVYRSSARNAQRLARTEINMAYRTAEQER